MVYYVNRKPLTEIQDLREIWIFNFKNIYFKIKTSNSSKKVELPMKDFELFYYKEKEALFITINKIIH